MSPVAPEAAAAPADQPQGQTRRQVLRTGAIGVAAAAFLAACTDARKKAHPKAGLSGSPVTTTEVAPSVPTTEPSAAALDEDITLLRTGTSLELLAAEVYRTYGPKLTDETWKSTVARFAADHATAAVTFTDATQANKRITKPNAFVKEHDVDPVAGDLTSDTAILDFFHDLESTLTATYVAAAGTFTSATWRQRVMTFGAASARRVGVLANGGEGAVPDSGLYPGTDLISNDAYVLSTPKKADAGA